MLPERTITCPYCGERFVTTVDITGGDQEYTEDCYVCCRPIVFTVSIGDDDQIVLTTRRESD